MKKEGTTRIELTDDFALIVRWKSFRYLRSFGKRLVNENRMNMGAYHDINQVNFLDRIETTKGVIVYEEKIYYFTELIAGFLAKQLTSKKIYSLQYQNGAGFDARWIQKTINDEKEHLLKITTSNKTYFLDKYTCRIFLKNFNSADHSCKNSKLHDHEFLFKNVED